MATTLTTDLIIPEVASTKAFDAIVATTRLSPLAEENRELEGGPGDRVKIGTYGAEGEAEDLAENQEIIPGKFTETGATFIVGRKGAGKSFTREARDQSGEDLSGRAGRVLGAMVARKIDRDLALKAYNGADAGRILTAPGTTPGLLDATLLTRGTAQFEDVDDEPVLVTTANGLASLGYSLGVFNAATFGGGEFIREGIRSVGRLLGVNVITSTRLPLYAAGSRASLLFVPNRTLVSAYSQRPLVEPDVKPARNAVDIFINTTWAGGVQERATLTVLRHSDAAPAAPTSTQVVAAA